MRAISLAVVMLPILSGLLLGSHMAVAHERAVTIHAGTEAQIVNAVLAANASGKPTIVKVAPGQYHFNTMFTSERGPSRLPPVTGKVLILAHDASNTVFQPGESGQGRIVTVLDGGRLIVENISLTGGFLLCQRDAFSDPAVCAGNAGAAAANFGGVLWLVNCFVSNNRAVATTDTGVFLHGGAISSIDGILRLEGTTVTDNHVNGSGGGVAIINGSATIHRSIISGNLVGIFLGVVSGGGVFASNAKLTVTDSTISGNSGPNDSDIITLGAGLYSEGGTLRIFNSAITENITPFGGAGGGIFNTGSLFIRNSTIGGNTTGVVGGGIYNSGRLVLESITLVRNEASGVDFSGPGSHASTFPGNCDRGEEGHPNCIHGGAGIWNDPAGSVQIQSSVIAENTYQSAPSDCNSALHSNGYNALGSSPDCHFENFRASDHLNIDVRLDELQDNGDAGNAYYPLLANSPLIDAGGKLFRQCTPRDQIGSRRNDGDGDGSVECDIGAIEWRR
jgi:hypothetical protein